MTIFTAYASMAKRIRACKTKADFDKIDQSLERLYNAGTFTVNEYMRLDRLALALRIDRTGDVI